MNRWLQAWQDHVALKKSQLCVGCDPPHQDRQQKMVFARTLIRSVAPYAAAIKINRQFIRDLAREDVHELTTLAHQLDCLVIDDSKIADIGSTNDAALDHAAAEGFDLITQCPFPGNLRATAAAGASRGVGVIALVLMSNPEYAVIRTARIGETPLFAHLARETGQSEAAGFVVGAPSASNGLTLAELQLVRELAGERLALVPGLGAQGGELDAILSVFGRHAILNVGRAIAANPDQAATARSWRDAIAAASK